MTLIEFAKMYLNVQDIPPHLETILLNLYGNGKIPNGRAILHYGKPYGKSLAHKILSDYAKSMELP